MTGLPFASRRTLNKHPSPRFADAISVTRFWSLVDVAGNDDCWPWNGDQGNGGYGVFVFQGRKFGAHELALSFATGQERPGQFDTCHECDNRLCCNPEHLRFDTRLSNVADCVDRKRIPRGEKHANACLTDEDVKAIRVLRAGGALQNELADRFGVSDGYISNIVNGLSRPEAGGPFTGKSKYALHNQTETRIA